MEAYFPFVFALIVGAYYIGRQHGVKVGANLGGQIKQAADATLAVAQAIGEQPSAFDAFVAPVEIGAHFTYLGLDLLCTGHSRLTPFGEQRCISAEYVADDGTIRVTLFGGTEIDALRVEIARQGVAITESRISPPPRQPKDPQ